MFAYVLYICSGRRNAVKEARFPYNGLSFVSPGICTCFFSLHLLRLSSSRPRHRRKTPSSILLRGFVFYTFFRVLISKRILLIERRLRPAGDKRTVLNFFLHYYCRDVFYSRYLLVNLLNYGILYYRTSFFHYIYLWFQGKTLT